MRRRAVIDQLDERLWEKIGALSTYGDRDHYESHATNPLSVPLARAEVMRAFDERRAALRDRFTALLAEPPDAADAVTVPAAIRHVARWDRAIAEVFAARNSNPEAPDDYSRNANDWNARWLAEDRGADPDESVREFDDAADRFRLAFDALDEDSWDRYGLEYALGTGRHYLSHVERPLEIPLPGDE